MSGSSTSTTLSLPMPANGATVSNLYAETNATVSGTDKANVEVINNTTGSAVLSCEVTAATIHTCSNTGAAGVPAGDKLEVKITTTGKSTAGGWEVTFRY